MNVIDAIHSEQIFAPLFKDVGTWRGWEVFLRALFGLGIEEAGDLGLFQASTGLEEAPREAAREAFCICGRRSGKSYISAIIACYLAGFKDWRPYLAAGERGWIFIVATDKDQAKIITNYISGIFKRVACLRRLVEKETRDELALTTGVSIAVKTASFRAVRGYTVLCAILEEMAFFRSEESANPDKDILAAIRPALATIPESLLIGISTPYSRSGVLWQMYRDYHGKVGGPLIWKAASLTMNPTLSKGLIESALRDDPQAARAEWEAEWREDVAAFISEEMVQGVTVPSRFELERIKGADYYAFIDPSGGRGDSFTVGIAHREGSGKVVLDVLRERRPPFQPKGVVEEFAEVLKAYGIGAVEGDRYAGQWVTEAFAEHGVEVRNSEATASEIYLAFLPMVMNGSVELLDNSRLVVQLAGLERRARVGGKDLVMHYVGGHDDLANSAAGACVLAGRGGGESGFVFFSKDPFY